MRTRAWRPALSTTTSSPFTTSRTVTVSPVTSSAGAPGEHASATDATRTAAERRMRATSDDAARPEQVEARRDAGADVLLGGVQHELGLRRRLVGVVDAGEALQLSGPSFLVEALRVALLADIER